MPLCHKQQFPIIITFITLGSTTINAREWDTNRDEVERLQEQGNEKKGRD